MADKDKQNDISPLDMSDEDILDQGESTFLAEEDSDSEQDRSDEDQNEDEDDDQETSNLAADDEDEDSDEDGNSGDNTDTGDNTDADDSTDSDEDDSDQESEDEDDQNKGDASGDSDSDTDDPTGDDDSDDTKVDGKSVKKAKKAKKVLSQEEGEKLKKDKKDKDSKNDTADSDEIKQVNYEVEYNKLLAPFRANGKELKVGSVDDAIALMKMGANYNKKMAGLKPNLKLMKMLENNNLLNEAKLSFLIDLDQKNPDAVAKFLKDSEIDPMEIDTDATSKYKPKTYTVHDKEMELDSVLDDIQDTSSFNTTIDIISNKWDSASKKIILEDPEIIRAINDHVANGIYDQIDQVIQSERMLGRLSGLSDLDAYKQIGDAIQAAEGFTEQPDNSDNAGNTGNTTNETQKLKIVSKPKKETPELKNRKRAAGSTKSSSVKKTPDFNPLSVSDEEFEKIAASQFM